MEVSILQSLYHNNYVFIISNFALWIHLLQPYIMLSYLYFTVHYYNVHMALFLKHTLELWKDYPVFK